MTHLLSVSVALFVLTASDPEPIGFVLTYQLSEEESAQEFKDLHTRWNAS